MASGCIGPLLQRKGSKLQKRERERERERLPTKNLPLRAGQMNATFWVGCASGGGVFHTKSSQFGGQLQRPEVRGAFPEGRGARQQKSPSSQRNGSSGTKGPLWEKLHIISLTPYWELYI